MGCGGSIARPVQPMTETDMFLKMSADHEKLKLKILLLGTGESGKSTFVKQTQLIAGSKDSAPEKASSIVTLRWNAIESLQILLREAAQQGITFADETLASSAAAVAALEINLPLDFTEQLARNMHALWMSPEIQRVYARRSEYWLLDTAPYYLNEIVRFASVDFEPTEEDFMMTRTRTTGIAVSEVVEKPYKFQIVDVGGQRSERRKWIHCFDDVKAVAYMASLSGYHQVLFEDSGVNMLRESLSFFEEMVQNPIFHYTPVFVLLNKKDVFDQLISTYPLTECFRDYLGPPGESAPAVDFIKKEFMEIMRTHLPGKAVQFIVMSATVRADSKEAFNLIKAALKKLHPVRKATVHRLPEHVSAHDS